jgi:hypothetical protein
LSRQEREYRLNGMLLETEGKSHCAMQLMAELRKRGPSPERVLRGGRSVHAWLPRFVRAAHTAKGECGTCRRSRGVIIAGALQASVTVCSRSSGDLRAAWERTRDDGR